MPVQLSPLSSCSVIGPALLFSHAVKPVSDIGRAAHCIFSLMQCWSTSPFACAASIIVLTSFCCSASHPGAPFRQAMPEKMPHPLSLATCLAIFCISMCWPWTLVDRTAVRKCRKMTLGSASVRYFPGQPRPAMSMWSCCRRSSSSSSATYNSSQDTPPGSLSSGISHAHDRIFAAIRVRSKDCFPGSLSTLDVGSRVTSCAAGYHGSAWGKQ